MGILIALRPAKSRKFDRSTRDIIRHREIINYEGNIIVKIYFSNYLNFKMSSSLFQN
jgi:hypothetical protein